MIMKKILLSLSLGLLVPSLHAAEAAEPKTSPNILLMMCDDMGWLDPSCFGNDRVATPNIDRLAKEGRMMSAFYAASAVCTPTRASVLTGKYPLRFDIRKHFNSAEGTPTKSVVPNSSRRPRRLLQLKLELASDVLGPSAS